LQPKGYVAALTNDALTGFLDLEPTELLNLPTVRERTAWLMGRVTDKTPTLVRPIVRSMLLPKLEALDSESLTEALELLRTVVLPWVLNGPSDEPDLTADEDYALA
jgi:hypothetical protein